MLGATRFYRAIAPAHYDRAAARSIPISLPLIPGCLVVIFGVDAILGHTHLPYFFMAVADETAHLATALLCLAALSRSPLRLFLLGALIASVLIDADHIPIVLDFHPLIAAAHRPYTHSLATVVLVLLSLPFLASQGRRIALGVAFGLIAHFLRDVATGSLPLFWPVGGVDAGVPYGLYLVFLLILAAVALIQRASLPFSRFLH